MARTQFGVGLRPEMLVADLAVLPPEPLGWVEVAIVDSGIDATHPDLEGRVVAAFDVDRSLRDPRVSRVAPGARDSVGHGTAVAGLVAAIAPNARLVDVRVLGDDNRGPGAGLGAGLARALERGCPVVNLSLSASREHAAGLWALCEQAYRGGQVVVAARRNVPFPGGGFPAGFSSVVSVDAGEVRAPLALRYRPGRGGELVARGDHESTAPGGGGCPAAGRATRRRWCQGSWPGSSGDGPPSGPSRSRPCSRPTPIAPERAPPTTVGGRIHGGFGGGLCRGARDPKLRPP